MTDEQAWEMVRESIAGMREEIAALGEKLDEFLSRRCPERHREIERRVTSLETRIYVAALILTLLASIFGGRIAQHWR